MKKMNIVVVSFFLVTSAYAAENQQTGKADLNSINMTMPGGGLQDDFGGPASAPGTFSGLALHGSNPGFVNTARQAAIEEELKTMKRKIQEIKTKRSALISAKGN